MRTRNVKGEWKASNGVFIIFLVLICVLFLQYCYVALFPVVYGINMDEFAANRNTYSSILYAKRGTIYDKDGNTLAQNVASYTVIAYLSSKRTTDISKPEHVVDVDLTANKLAPLINMTEGQLLKLLKTEGVYQVELGPGGRGITELKKDEIVDLNLPGIDFIENSKRYYPNGDFAPYIIGYAKENERYVDNGSNKTLVKSIDGELGIEARYDDVLKGANGKIEYQQDRFGYKIPETDEWKLEPKNGQDIYLTLDSNIQRFVETSVKEANLIYKPEWLMFHVMDAKTGDILASSSTPSFDPNKRNIVNYENPLVSYVYEPGSTMKTFTYMCAIDKGTYRGNDTYMSGSIDVGDRVISDWNKYGWGTINFDLGYEYSSNTAITNVVQKFIDKTDLKNCLNKYGFGMKTDIELPRELEGVIKFNYPVEIASAGFGQGISITPIQLLQALTIIANNGKMVKPHIINKIVDTNTNKTVYDRVVLTSDQVVSEATVKKMRELMWNTVNANNPGTTGNGYKIDGFDIIGKTGSAEIFDNEHGRYYTGWNDYIYSFTGMFPKEDPKIIVYAAIKRPISGLSGSLTGLTKNIIQNIAKYKNIYGDKMAQESLALYQVNSYINKDTVMIKKELEDNKIVPIIIGTGDKIIKQYPNDKTTLIGGDKVYLLTNGFLKVMPDLLGWSRIEVISLFKMLNLQYEVSGIGYVTKQSLQPGSLILDDMVVNVTLENKYNIDKKAVKKVNE